jgi:hypothetical protein
MWRKNRSVGFLAVAAVSVISSIEVLVVQAASTSRTDAGASSATAAAAVVTTDEETVFLAEASSVMRRLKNGTKGDSDNDDGTVDSTQFPHFIAHNKTMTCSADEHAMPFNNQIRGVNLGGWMVLEPWITPSLFLQFLGKGEGSAAFDMYTFCEVLGPEEANRQLVRHWDAWVTEDIIRSLKESGAVNSLRLPVGDFMFVPYGPYADGCVEGALERVDQLLDWAYSYGLTVLFDVHTMRDSQNGFDNSGQAMGFAWTSACTYQCLLAVALPFECIG